ncbi:MAG: thiopeptide-type bacteriocin biosynthesis protein [Pseudonocardia sp.]|nr:thiopeptide-type bacteriocin biosynthesis protein [Pseudonocardia sp.]
MRLRFACGPADTGELAAEVAAAALSWRADGLVADCVPGCYEPESALFGGAASMEHAHELFEADSLTWLDGHSRGVSRPSWVMSLLMVRAVLDGLAITGFEDLGVWTELRDRWHRRLPGELLATPPFMELAPLVQEGWQSPDLFADALDADDRCLVESFRRAVLAIAQRWRREYFDTSAARRGPRRTAAGVVAFHWNRAGLTSEWQAVLTEALLADPDQPR